MRALLLLLLVLLGGEDDLPRNDPSLCPYCKNDPELMRASGTVSHGGFGFCRLDTKGMDHLLAPNDVYWIETAHMEIGLAIGPYKLKSPDEIKKVRGELERLVLVLPDINPKTRIIDPWLRAHLFAQRLEDHYADFLALVGVDDSVFPDGSKPWDTVGTYWGEGPYLGQKGKYEVLVTPNESAHLTVMQDQFGLPHKTTQRWNIVDTSTQISMMHLRHGQLRTDTGLHCHAVFNTTLNFYNGFKFYAYDSPVWLREGLGHWFERRIDPRYNTFDSSEGSTADMSRKKDWGEEVKKLITSGRAPRMAELVNLKSFAEFDLPDHYVTWSIVDYLTTVYPEAFPEFLRALKGRWNGKTMSDGSELKDVQRDLFRDLFGGTYAQFDEKWAEWALATY